MKLERLRFEARMGLEALDAGEFVEVDDADLRTLAEEVKAEGHETTGATLKSGDTAPQPGEPSGQMPIWTRLSPGSHGWR